MANRGPNKKQASRGSLSRRGKEPVEGRSLLTKEFLALVGKLGSHVAVARESPGELRLPERGALSVLAHAVHDGLTILLIASPRDFWVRLSEREREIVRLCVEGRSAKEIAVALTLKASTVASKLRLIYAKLGVGSKAALIRSAFAHVEHELATADESASNSLS